ncbi:hypothetical protein BDV34DRAFT_211527 [Aspergillus parasiticus]|uniref:Uncharacterized protein n=1 Tax=Aspergillus parasiticus TaxID=5067 RepID=A0A5N6DQT8_ASPPA|nr:hypothetical protein BDV34DRAFT_211527 [Aspergillus parasiticus]
MAKCPSGNCSVRVLTRNQKRQEFTYDPANPQEAWQDFKWRILNFTQGYIEHTWDIPFIEEGLHDLWDELIHVAKRHPADSAEHDRLVTLVLEAREWGTVARKKKDASTDEEPEQVILSNGQRLWVDLPYLVQEFQDAWMKELCAVGVYPSELGRCALWLFKEAFETERPLTRVEGDATNACVPIVELLPACHAWLKYNSFKLAIAQASTAPGDLSPKSEFPCSGFSIPRWVFWRRRYKYFYHCGTEQVAKLARACFEEAMFKGTRMALDAEMIARGMHSVEPQDIEIDMDWAEEH